MLYSCSWLYVFDCTCPRYSFDFWYLLLAGRWGKANTFWILFSRRHASFRAWFALWALTQFCLHSYCILCTSNLQWTKWQQWVVELCYCTTTCQVLFIIYIFVYASASPATAWFLFMQWRPSLRMTNRSLAISLPSWAIRLVWSTFCVRSRSLNRVSHPFDWTGRSPISTTCLMRPEDPILLVFNCSF